MAGEDLKEGTETHSLEEFRGVPTRDLEAWHWLWATDQTLPIESHRGLGGRLVVFFKRLMRPLVKSPQNDLWDRQRVFNLVLMEHLPALREGIEDLAEHANHHITRLERQQRELTDYLDKEVLDQVKYLASSVEKLEGYRVEGLEDVMRHNDALFALMDQKLDHYRRETQDLWGRLGGALARVEKEDVAALVRTREEQGYVELERRHRGTEEDIETRLSHYLRYLEERGEVLDLGCGRGESLTIMGRHGIPARGVDSSVEMVEQCREKGLDAEVGDLFEVLEQQDEGSLGGVVSFHVIEHLPPESLDRLVRLAWRALRPGGVLILETPSPLSLLVTGRNFWIDPTHRRPVHPASLQLMFRLAGFEPVEQVDLRPFEEEDRLPRLEAREAPQEVRGVVEGVNELRDRLDDLLFGYQDFGMVGFKP